MGVGFCCRVVWLSESGFSGLEDSQDFGQCSIFKISKKVSNDHFEHY